MGSTILVPFRKTFLFSIDASCSVLCPLCSSLLPLLLLRASLSVPRMEPASELLARPLPPLRFAGGTLYPSVSSERLHESFMHQWTTFEQEIQSALDSLDLNHTVSHTDSADGEFYLVGNEIGLTGRFVNNPCDPVAKILSRASIPSVAFGDIQALLAASSIILGRGLGVTSRNDSKTTVMAVGELKTFWTLPLERLPVVNHLARVELEPYLGMFQAS